MRRPTRIVIALLLLGVAPAAGQVRLAAPTRPPGAVSGGESIELAVDREAARKIRAIKPYLKQSDPPWATIVEVSQRLMDGDQDSLMEITYKDDEGNEQRTKVSVRAEVTRMIGTFPPGGLQAYEATFGPAAKGILDDAFQNNDLVALSDVARRFLHTRAGRKATVLLGTYYLDRGYYQEAAGCLIRLGLRADAAELDAPTLFKTALALRRSGERSSADKYWARFVAAADGPVKFASRAFTVEQLRAAYDADAGSALARAADAWVCYRGDESRNAFARGGRPFLSPSFARTMLPDYVEYNDPRPALDWIDQNLKAMRQLYEGPKPLVPLPAFSPIAAGDKIIFRDYRGIQAVGLRDDPSASPPVRRGEVVWPFQCDHSLFSMIVEDPERRNFMDKNWLKGQNNNQFYFSTSGPYGIFFENGLLGALSHDGGRAYFIDDQAVPPHPLLVAQQANRRGQTVSPFGAFENGVLHNRLVALELDTGKLAWSLGWRPPEAAESGDGEPAKKVEGGEEFEDAHFLGAPLPLSGRLYVVMERAGDLKLACLDPRQLVGSPRPGVSGEKIPKLVWSQTLGRPDRPIPQDSFRRIQGVNLAFGGGIIVCPTNCGVVVGVELLTRTLAWAHPYREGDAKKKKPPVRPGAGLAIRGRVSTNVGDLNRGRWRGGAPMIVDGKVLFTAYDCDSVRCLDLSSGRLVWKHDRRPDDLYLAGAFKGNAVIVGRRAVRAVSLKDGKTVQWEVQTGEPAGQGSATADAYYLPLREARGTLRPELWAIDLATGKVLSRGKLAGDPDDLGNLIFHKGSVIAQSARKVAVYPQLDVLRESIDRRLAKDPGNPAALVDRGRLNLYGGDFKAAVKDLRKALKAAREAGTKGEAAATLREALAEAARRDFAFAERYLPEFKALSRAPDDRATYLWLLARGRRGQGREMDALEAYLEYAAIPGGNLEPSADEPELTARRDVRARGAVREMYEAARGPTRDQMDGRFTKAYREALKAGGADKLSQFTTLFGGWLPDGDAARLELAGRLAGGDADDARRAASLLAAVRASADGPRAALATGRLADLYVRRAAEADNPVLFREAVALYRKLGEEYADAELPGGRSGADYLIDLVTDKRFQPRLEPARPRWAENYVAEVQTTFAGSTAAGPFTLRPRGEQPALFGQYRLEVQIKSGTKWTLSLADRATGQPKWGPVPIEALPFVTNPRNANARPARVHGHTLLLTAGPKVIAIDLTGGEKLWEYDLLGERALASGPVTTDASDPSNPRLVYRDGWSLPIGRGALVRDSYVALNTRDGLTAVDPQTGAELWRRSGVQSRVRLMGDERHIFLFEYDENGRQLAGPVKVLRASDGRMVKAVKGVPDPASAAAHGESRMLVFSGGTEPKMLLIDVMTGKAVWAKKLPKGTLPLRTRREHRAGYLTPAGEAVAFNARTGEEDFRARLQPVGPGRLAEHLKNLQTATLLSDAERDYVCLARRYDAADGRSSPNPVVYGGVPTQPVNGALYCFDRASGEMLWYTADAGQSYEAHDGTKLDRVLNNQLILLEQFRDLPVIVAASRFQKRSGGRYTNQMNEVVVIDKRTGAQLLPAENGKDHVTIPGNRSFTTMRVDRRGDTVELVGNRLRVLIKPAAGKKK